MANSTVLILTAVKPEARAIARAFLLAQTSGPLPFWQRGQLNLACVGIAANGLARLDLDGLAIQPRLVVMAGVAGALSPELRVGDVVLEVRDADTPPPPLAEVRIGRLHTSSELLTTPSQKQRLFQQTGCLAVDMETDLAWRFAQRRHAAFVAIRGISDAANEMLDPRLLTLVDPAGNPRVARAMTMLCARPWKLPELLRLQSATSLAMKRVARVLEQLIASGWPANTTVPPSGN